MTDKQKELRKKNKQKIKEYKKQLNSEIFDLDKELKYNENGEALIECKIGKAENIFNKHDLAQDRCITDEFEKYLLDEVEIIPLADNVAINMYVDSDFTLEHEQQVRKAIKNHFSFKITSDKVKMRSNDISATIFFILGIIALAFSPFVYKWFENSYIPLYESTLILVWFFLYEGTYMAFFDRAEIKEHRYNMLRLYNANISFIRPTETASVESVDKIKLSKSTDKPKKPFSFFKVLGEKLKKK